MVLARGAPHRSRKPTQRCRTAAGPPTPPQRRSERPAAAPRGSVQPACMQVASVYTQLDSFGWRHLAASKQTRRWPLPLPRAAGRAWSRARGSWRWRATASRAASRRRRARARRRWWSTTSSSCRRAARARRGPARPLAPGRTLPPRQSLASPAGPACRAGPALDHALRLPSGAARGEPAPFQRLFGGCPPAATGARTGEAPARRARAVGRRGHNARGAQGGAAAGAGGAADGGRAAQVDVCLHGPARGGGPPVPTQLNHAVTHPPPPSPRATLRRAHYSSPPPSPARRPAPPRDTLRSELRLVRDDLHRVTLELREREIKVRASCILILGRRSLAALAARACGWRAARPLAGAAARQARGARRQQVWSWAATNLTTAHPPHLPHPLRSRSWRPSSLCSAQRAAALRTWMSPRARRTTSSRCDPLAEAGLIVWKGGCEGAGLLGEGSGRTSSPPTPSHTPAPSRQRP